MSEEIVDFFPTPGSRWVLSRADHRILDELYIVLWSWLPDVADGAQVSAFGRLMTSFEVLMEDGTPPSPGEVETAVKPNGSDGIGVHVAMSPSMIELSASEYVWMEDQGHDQSSMLDDEGRPFNLTFTPDGSFDRKMFDRWIGWAEDATDQQVHGGRSEAHASYYGDDH